MDIDELRGIAAREGLSLNFVAKDEMISKALLALQGFEGLILKGGTAINRVYLRNKRFSEDIDFDFVFKGTVKESVLRIKEVVERLSGFEVSRAYLMNDTVRYDLFFVNTLNHKDRVRLELNIVKTASSYGKKVVNFGFVPYDSSLLSVYDVESLIQQKIECVMNRVEGKDFFDLYYLLDTPHKTVAMLKRYREKEKIINRINLEEKQIGFVANVANHYIPKNNRPVWSMFLEELKEKVRKY